MERSWIEDNPVAFAVLIAVGVALSGLAVWFAFRDARTRRSST